MRYIQLLSVRMAKSWLVAVMTIPSDCGIPILVNASELCRGIHIKLGRLLLALMVKSWLVAVMTIPSDCGIPILVNASELCRDIAAK
jgi:nitrogen fixation protein